MQKNRENLPEDEKAKLNEADKKRKETARTLKASETAEIFAEVENKSKVDHSILKTKAYQIVKSKFENSIKEGPTYTCDICWKNEFRGNVVKLNFNKYEENAINKCQTGKSEWVCKKCHSILLKEQLPPEAQVNDLHLCDPVEELTDLYAMEHMLLCQIIPFMFLVSRQKGAQQGLKGQVVLVPTDLKRITQVLPRSCNDGHLITIALKRRLSDKGAYKEQHIRPSVVNKALDYLVRNNHLYNNVTISNDWEKIK